MALGPMSLADVLRSDFTRGRLASLADFDATVDVRQAALPLSADERQDVALARSEIGKAMALRGRP